MTTRRFDFAFTHSHGLPARAFGVTPARAWVEVSEQELRIRFGWWRLRTARDNVESATESGPYSWWRTAGPARLSFADRGLTFATNGERGLCISFREPVRAIEPLGVLRHPGVTVTVADVQGLKESLQATG